MARYCILLSRLCIEGESKVLVRCTIALPHVTGRGAPLQGSFARRGRRDLFAGPVFVCDAWTRATPKRGTYCPASAPAVGRASRRRGRTARLPLPVVGCVIKVLFRPQAASPGVCLSAVGRVSPGRGSTARRLLPAAACVARSLFPSIRGPRRSASAFRRGPPRPAPGSTRVSRCSASAPARGPRRTVSASIRSSCRPASARHFSLCPTPTYPR